MTDARALVSLGADVGGEDADAATSEACMALRRALAKECRGPYGSAFKEFALVVRIDGSVQSWGKKGVDNVRLQRKSKYATADIFVPKDAWMAGPSRFRDFLATNVAAAVQEIVDRAKKAGDQIEADMLRADVKRAIERAAR